MTLHPDVILEVDSERQVEPELVGIAPAKREGEAVTGGPKRPTLNRARAIREQCLECMGYQVQLINRCPDTACPLWEWRRGPGAPERTISPLRRQTHTRPLPAPSERPCSEKCR